MRSASACQHHRRTPLPSNRRWRTLGGRELEPPVHVGPAGGGTGPHPAHARRKHGARQPRCAGRHPEPGTRPPGGRWHDTHRHSPAAPAAALAAVSGGLLRAPDHRRGAAAAAGPQRELRGAGGALAPHRGGAGRRAWPRRPPPAGARLRDPGREPAAPAAGPGHALCGGRGAASRVRRAAQPWWGRRVAGGRGGGGRGMAVGAGQRMGPRHRESCRLGVSARGDRSVRGVRCAGEASSARGKMRPGCDAFGT